MSSPSLPGSQSFMNAEEDLEDTGRGGGGGGGTVGGCSREQGNLARICL